MTTQTPDEGRYQLVSSTPDFVFWIDTMTGAIKACIVVGPGSGVASPENEKLLQVACGPPAQSRSMEDFVFDNFGYFGKGGP